MVKPDRGGHSAEPTPAGHYVLGRKEHVVTNGWPKSSICYGTALRVAPNGEVEFRGDHGGWHWATGPAGKVTQAELGFYARDHHPVSLPEAMAKARGCFFNAVGTLISNVWTRNDFGLWGWNLQRHDKRTVFFVHTTPRDEDYTALGVAFALQNSHGCVHVFPRERDEMVAAGFLKEGVPFDVRPYSETGPP